MVKCHRKRRSWLSALSTNLLSVLCDRVDASLVRHPNEVTRGAVGSAPVTTHEHTTITADATVATVAADAAVAADATVATTTADATVATVVADATVVAVAAVATCFEHAANPRGVSWSAA